MKDVNQINNSLWSKVKAQFFKNRLAVFAGKVILFLAVIALFADFIANEKPLIASYKDKVIFPIFKSYAVDAGITSWQSELQNVEWNKLEYDWVVFPLIPYSSTNIDAANSQYVGPFSKQQVKSMRWRHWLGTDLIGRDILSGLIHGTRISLSVGVFSMGIALLIGVILGSLAGYYGDDKLKISKFSFFVYTLFILFGLFYSFQVRWYKLTDSLEEGIFYFLFQFFLSLLLFFAFFAFAYFIQARFKKFKLKTGYFLIPVDMLVMRAIEVFLSIPTLFLILAIISIAKPSLFLVIMIIGLTAWTGIARFLRAELLRVRKLEFIEAAQALGINEFKIILKHALPNALSSVFIAASFGIASAILTEATLSFLGLGVPAEVVTWGSLLSSAKEASSAWWLAVFPGLAIFVTVTAYNIVGEGITDSLDPKLRK